MSAKRTVPSEHGDELVRYDDAEIVHNWRQRYPDFPAPVAVLRQAMVSAWPDIEKWARATGRLTT